MEQISEEMREKQYQEMLENHEKNVKKVEASIKKLHQSFENICKVYRVFQNVDTTATIRRYFANETIYKLNERQIKIDEMMFEGKKVINMSYDKDTKMAFIIVEK